jgi:hypothetical protein
MQDAARPSGAADTLTRADFGLGAEGPPDTATTESLFKDLVGMTHVRSKLQDYHNIIRLALSKGQDPREHIGYNFLFVGSPGTGAQHSIRSVPLQYRTG